MERRPGPWPKINQRVEAQTGTAGWFPTRIEDREGRGIVIAAPSGTRGEPVRVAVGDPVALRWADWRGLGRLDANVIGLVRRPLGLWLLEAVDAPAQIQRRRFARVPLMMPVRVAGSRAGLLFSVNVAEGGMLCAAPGQSSFEPGESLTVKFSVDGGPVEAAASVVRSQPASGGAMVAFAFSGLSGRDADRLRRLLYRRQVELAGAGRA
jgi:PilZ domain/Flagellar protein YcgR